jgi:hypothetical protein
MGNGRIRIQEAQKHTDPTDLDLAPEHCILQTNRELEATPRARVSDPDPHPDPH